MYGSDKAVTDDTDRTEFRKTEKKYKLYYDQNSKRYDLIFPFLK
jgi:alkylated DNA repair protein alkB family protein 1